MEDAARASPARQHRMSTVNAQAIQIQTKIAATALSHFYDNI
jgi:hypothetical protein